MPTLSFEFFPPRNEAAATRMERVVPELAALDPAFMTVTFGAGGTTQEGTENTVLKIQSEHNVPTAMHLTYIDFTITDCMDYVNELWGMGIRHLVALRGDLPADLQWPLDRDGDYFQYTSDFVAAIKERHPFEISVGAYPEKHPDAPDLSSDIQALKYKCDAGADRAITQFFFNNDVYYHFLDEVLKAGIDTPVVPGILPIANFEKMCRFAKSCETDVPAWLCEKFDGLERKPEEAAKIAEEILYKQLQDLTDHKIPHFHIYTMNRSGPIVKACEKIGLCGLMPEQQRRKS